MKEITMLERIPGPWGSNYECALSLTFDDGMDSQLETAVPLLAKSNLHGTFYVNPSGSDWRKKLLPWETVAGYGHEIGNHTISHPCACAFKENRSNCLETMTLEDIDWEVGEGKRRISEAIPIQDDFTFCYPCYHAHVGEGIKRQSYVPVVAKYHSAGRGKGDYANHPLTSDIHHLYSFPVERHALSEMIVLIEETAVQKRWVILTFHGISEGHLSVNKSDFKGLCEYLQKHNKRIWTAPVVNVSKAIGAWRIQKT